jgi:hypothetical protein
MDAWASPASYRRAHANMQHWQPTHRSESTTANRADVGTWVLLLETERDSTSGFYQ